MVKKVNKDNFTRLISLLIAIGLWLYVVYAENPRQEVWLKGIPITYVNTQSLAQNSLVILDGTLDTASVKISGRRKNIVLIKQSNITAQVDLSGITGEGRHKLPVKTSFPIDGIDIIDKNPYSVSLTIEPLVEKSVPVRIVSTGDPAAGYVVDSTAASPSSIRIKGAKSIMSVIDYAVVSVSTKGISESFNIPSDVSLIKTDGSGYKGEDIEILDNKVLAAALVVKIKQVDINPQVSSPDGEIQSVALDTVRAEIKAEGTAVDSITELYTKPLAIPYSETPVTVTLEIDKPEAIICNVDQVQAVVTFKTGETRPGDEGSANETH